MLLKNTSAIKLQTLKFEGEYIPLQLHVNEQGD